MKPEELERFQQLLAAYVQAMRLQGLRERTIETYSRSLWQVSKHFRTHSGGGTPTAPIHP